MLYRSSFVFRLTRLVPWADDGDDFYGHVETVREKVAAHEMVQDARCITDIAENRLNLEVVLEAERHDQAIPSVLRIVRDSIENSGARHFGMGAISRNRFSSSGAATSPVTPIWHRLRVLVDLAA